jgi:hypothetical protein
MADYEHLLNQTFFDAAPGYGEWFRQSLTKRADELAAETPAPRMDPDVTIATRLGSTVQAMNQLSADISKNAVPYLGQVQPVLWGSLAADLHVEDCDLVPVSPEAPLGWALNQVMSAAEHPYVWLLNGHARLATDVALRGLTRWHTQDKFAGTYGVTLPGVDAEHGAWVKAGLTGLAGHLRHPKVYSGSIPAYALPAVGSIISKAAWQEVGKFNEELTGPEATSDFVRRLGNAGFSVVREPALSVFYTRRNSQG